MKGVPWRSLVEAGAKSREKTEAQLEKLGPGLSILIHLDSLSSSLRRELRRWKRKQLLAAIRGEDPSKIDPPATIRAELAAQFVESNRKLVLSLEEFDIVEDEVVLNGERGV